MNKEVIQQTSSAYESAADAQDALHGMAALDGYLFGYVDARHRTISFHEVNASGSQLHKRQRRVSFVLLPSSAQLGPR